jgi:hypothetical protein
MHLTYPNSDPHIGTASPVDSGKAGAPEHEIEVPPETIEAMIEDWVECNRDSIEAGGVGDVSTLRRKINRIFLLPCAPVQGPQDEGPF